MASANTIADLMAASESASSIDLLTANTCEIIVEKDKIDSTYKVFIRVDDKRVLFIAKSKAIITDLLGRLGSQEDMGRPGNGRPVRPI